MHQLQEKILDFTTREVTYPEPEEEEFFQATLLFPPGSFSPHDDPTDNALDEDEEEDTPSTPRTRMMRTIKLMKEM